MTDPSAQHTDDGHPHHLPPGESPRWLDEPANLKKLALAVYVAAGLLILVPELLALAGVYHKHGHFSWEDWPGFYSLYGFIAYALVVALGMGLQKVVSREEGYYDE